jgi:hypothetical protein
MVLSSVASSSGNTSRRLCDHADVVVRIFSVDDSCSPLQNNLLCCLLTICYTKACLEGIAYLRRKLDSAQSSSCYYSKQLLYATLCSNVLFWSLFDNGENDNWSWRLNIVVPSAMLVRFIYKVRIVLLVLSSIGPYAQDLSVNLGALNDSLIVWFVILLRGPS